MYHSSQVRLQFPQLAGLFYNAKPHLKYLLRYFSIKASPGLSGTANICAIDLHCRRWSFSIPDSRALARPAASSCPTAIVCPPPLKLLKVS